MQLLPLEPNLEFSYRVVLETYTVALRFKWLAIPEIWVVDCAVDELNFSLTGFQVVTGLDLFHGRGLYQFGKLIFLDMQGQLDPDFDNFGSRYRLIYVSRAEVENGDWS